MADSTKDVNEDKLSTNSASTSNQTNLENLSEEKKTENEGDRKVLLNNEAVNTHNQQEQQTTLLSELEDIRPEDNETTSVKSRSKRNVIKVPMNDGYLDEEGNLVDESRIFD